MSSVSLRRVLVLGWFACCYLFSPQRLQALDSSSIRIGSFNIQVFGASKVSNPHTLSILVKILARYDLVFVQEIRDSSEYAINHLLRELNAATGRKFALALSNRLGRSVSKEQYAYIYDQQRVRLLEAYTYNDHDDRFEREPYVARFQAGDMQFSMVGIHITPQAVASELRSLSDVYRSVLVQQGHSEIFVLGDFNGDCNYYNAQQGFQYFDDPAFELLAEGTDTTVSATHCAYDRVLAFGRLPEYASPASVFRFSEELSLTEVEALDVSDHFPVEFSLHGTGAEKLPLPLPAASDPVLDSNAPLDPPLPVEPPSIPAPTLPPPTSSSCGLSPYLTQKGYCYASFSAGKRRVAASCCELSMMDIL